MKIEFDAKLASLAFFVWVTAIAIVTGLHESGWSAWLTGWFKWDAKWYARIWSEGYSADLRMLVFPPLYSLVTGAVSRLTTLSFSSAALLVNLPSYFIFAWFSSRTLAARFDLNRGALYVFALASPVGFYAFTVYSDVFFAMVFWILLPLALKKPSELSRGERLLAWTLTLISPFLRLTGYAFVTWLPFRRWFAFMPLVALGGWLVINQWYSGDPWFFLHAQQEFDMPHGNLVDGVLYHWSKLIDAPFINDDRAFWLWLQSTLLPLISTGLLLLTCAWLVRRREWLLIATIVSVMLISRNQAFWRSVFRYDLPLMPMIALPWLAWFKESFGTRLGGFESSWAFDWRRSVSIICGLLFFLLVLAGLVSQFVFSRVLHAGSWAF